MITMKDVVVGEPALGKKRNEKPIPRMFMMEQLPYLKEVMKIMKLMDINKQKEIGMMMTKITMEEVVNTEINLQIYSFSSLD